MGYKRERKVYRIAFDPGHELAGLVMQCRSISTGKFTELTRLAARFAGGAGEGADFTAADADAIERLFTGFAGALVSWNLEDDNGPVPATLAGVNDQDFDFNLQLIDAWMEAVAGVPAELGKGLPSGPQYPEVSLPMAALSPALPS